MLNRKPKSEEGRQKRQDYRTKEVFSISQEKSPKRAFTPEEKELIENNPAEFIRRVSPNLTEEQVRAIAQNMELAQLEELADKARKLLRQ